VSVTWLLVFLAQVILVAAGRVTVHRQLGVLGVLLSAAFTVVTWLVLVEGARRGFDLSGDLVPRGTSTDPGTFLAPSGSLIPFAAFVAAAVWYRKRPVLHKRLMMLALLTSTGAPIAHVVGHWPAFAPFALAGGTLLFFLPAIRDRVCERRMHPVSLWAQSSPCCGRPCLSESLRGRSSGAISLSGWLDRVRCRSGRLGPDRRVAALHR
jgi:hypothetical protein